MIPLRVSVLIVVDLQKTDTSAQIIDLDTAGGHCANGVIPIISNIQPDIFISASSNFLNAFKTISRYLWLHPRLSSILSRRGPGVSANFQPESTEGGQSIIR